MRIERGLGLGILIGIIGVLMGCPGFQYVDADVDRTPTVDTGAGATIIYPGETAPPVTPGAQPPYGAAQAAQPPPEYGSAQGSDVPGATAAPSGGGVTMIGGSKIDEKTHIKIRSGPAYWKYMMLPFAVIAAPFKYAAEAARGKPEAGPPIPENSPQTATPPPCPAPIDYETAALQNMERELAQRSPTTSGTQTSTPTRASTAPAPSRGLSIAEELAALRAPAQNPAPQATAPFHASTTPAVSTSPPSRVRGADPSLVSASGVVDRNGDGQTDHWIFRENGQMTREAYDENFDGVPDRTLHYDLASHQVVRIEEDTNQDGNFDSWAALRNGAVTRRRVDADDDGRVDSWSFYNSGQITRLERDSSGDGFRDHVAFYQEGRIEREEVDGNADGRLDLIKHYDPEERVTRVEEDSDGDGHIDVISHYAGGRLSRRELLDASILDAEETDAVEQN